VELAVDNAAVRDAAVSRAAARGLPEIPVVDVGTGGPVALFEARRAAAAALLSTGCETYGRLAIALGDRISRRWLARAANPYLGEIDRIAATGDRPGVYTLNLSYEWFCTSGVAPDPEGRGNRMLRTLDWSLDGLGRHAVVARFEGAAGAYYNITWPGFVGVVTAMAPGRFSAALNQAPMARKTPFLALDWAQARLDVWRGRGLPPVHLLRRVFDNCETFAEARAMLCEVPVSLPGFFTLSGVEADEGCVIERFDHRAVVHDSPIAVANHWLTPGLGGEPRGVDSYERRVLMEAALGRRHAGFRWLRAPVLNECTRLAVIANAATGRLTVQGFEGGAPATAVRRL